MRLSAILAASIGVATLLSITACQAPEPVQGTVVGKEHKPATQSKAKKTCSHKRQSNGKYREVCSTPTKGATAECYELEIRTKDGSEVEFCDKAAYQALDLDDPYDSTQDYSREEQ